MDVVLLSRLQFALTIMFHYLFPPLTIGLGVVLVWLEGRHLATKDPLYDVAARFWTRIFALNFAVGVATGTALGASVNITVLTIALRFLVGPMRGQRVWSAGAKILAASIVTGAIAWAVWRLVEHWLPVDADVLWLASLARLSALGIPVAVGLVVYVLTCRLLRLAEINEVVGPIHERLRRG